MAAGCGLARSSQMATGTSTSPAALGRSWALIAGRTSISSVLSQRGLTSTISAASSPASIQRTWSLSLVQRTSAGASRAHQRLIASGATLLMTRTFTSRQMGSGRAVSVGDRRNGCGELIPSIASASAKRNADTPAHIGNARQDDLSALRMPTRLIALRDTRSAATTSIARRAERESAAPASLKRIAGRIGSVELSPSAAINAAGFYRAS